MKITKFTYEKVDPKTKERTLHEKEILVIVDTPQLIGGIDLKRLSVPEREDLDKALSVLKDLSRGNYRRYKTENILRTKEELSIL